MSLPPASDSRSLLAATTCRHHSNECLCVRRRLSSAKSTQSRLKWRLYPDVHSNAPSSDQRQYARTSAPLRWQRRRRAVPPSPSSPQPSSRPLRQPGAPRAAKGRGRSQRSRTAAARVVGEPPKKMGAPPQRRRLVRGIAGQLPAQNRAHARRVVAAVPPDEVGKPVKAPIRGSPQPPSPNGPAAQAGLSIRTPRLALCLTGRNHRRGG